MLYRKFLFFTSLIILLTFACTNKKSETKYLIGFSQCNSAEPWRENMNQDLVSEVEKHKDIEIIISDAQQDNSKQVADIENFIVKEVDLIIVSPNEAKPLTNIVEKAYKSGIPIIILDRKISSDNYTTFIGADNYLIGKAAGNYILELLGNKGNIVEIWGLKGSTPAIDRHNGFWDAVKDKEDVKIVYAQDGSWLRRRGLEIMENALQKYEKIDLVYAHNDPMAIGAYIAAKNAGREQDIYFIGIDGLKGAEGGINSVSQGALNATFIYPNGSKEAIETAINILEGKTVPKDITLKTLKITSGNAQKYLK